MLRDRRDMSYATVLKFLRTTQTDADLVVDPLRRLEFCGDRRHPFVHK